MKKILIACLTFVVLLIVMMEVLTFIGIAPDIKVVTGVELPASAKRDLVQSGIISNTEEIYYFYSEDIVSFVNYGNMFTNARVISYELDTDSDVRNIYSAKYSEISDIKFNKSTEYLGDSAIEIFVDGEMSFTLVVSNEERKDEVFFKKLVEVWQTAKNH